ncbi:GTPase domain-containing protein [Arcanobacterium hippocoleae]|uniref:Energy-coupling factor transporter ATP-binding protein EcfA2 n=1 Tax=Arcanobacterium hippocoleae TaxID=149017 RepID=A0ABU1T2S6_9ACTO|nr:GTPase domain-containing protein [Arcanobacterium hippocoleae]MDR6939165.1 energy-coupling factor transporter ATP-binding protein EcfA2 [Arcanobacterium hippocoleae]
MAKVKRENKALADLTKATIATLRQAKFPLIMPGSAELTQACETLLIQLQTRFLPQVTADAFPVVVVFGGSSGAGKSTLVNSILGTQITPASIIRPTTTEPVLVVHPDDAAAIKAHPLSEFTKVVVDENAIAGLVLVDAPDLDTINKKNQALSRRLLECADLWVFTTTAARYGDAIAWQTLELADQRGITCAVVLNRLPERAATAVREDLRKRLITADLAGSPLFVIPDYSPMEGLLQAQTVAEIKNWLVLLAQTTLAETVAARTMQALLPTLRAELKLLAEGIEAQANALTDLQDQAREAAAAPLMKLTTNARAGRFGQGAPTAAWLALASTGTPLAAMVGANGAKPSLLQRLRSNREKRDIAIRKLFDTVLAGIQAALFQALVTTQERIEREWENDVVDTKDFIASGKENVELLQITHTAIKQWQVLLKSIAQNSRRHCWLSSSGNAALIGSAAAGISGVMKLAVQFDLESDVRQARRALADCMTQAVEQIVAGYNAKLANIKLLDPTSLQLRAAEFADRI